MRMITERSSTSRRVVIARALTVQVTIALRRLRVSALDVIFISRLSKLLDASTCYPHVRQALTRLWCCRFVKFWKTSLNVRCWKPEFE